MTEAEPAEIGRSCQAVFVFQIPGSASIQEDADCGNVAVPGGAVQSLPIGSIMVPFCGLYLGSYEVIPKRNYSGAYG